jgi:hypothetical protein
MSYIYDYNMPCEFIQEMYTCDIYIQQIQPQMSCLKKKTDSYQYGTKHTTNRIPRVFLKYKVIKMDNKSD